MENLRKDQHVLKDVELGEQPDNADFHRLMEMASSEKGVYQMQNIVKHWEYKRANTARLLKEELDVLSQQRRDIEQKMQQMLEEQHFHDGSNCAVKQQVPILDEVHKDEWMCLSKKSDKTSHNQELKIDAEYESISYWKERAMHFEKAFDASLQREHSLEKKLERFINNLQDTSLDDFSGMLKQLDYFLHLVLRSAPIVIAHQDTDLRYRFLFNHYPTRFDEDVIGKTDHEIMPCESLDEMNNVEREVMAKGISAKREFEFNTPLFGVKTFLAYIEPVFSKFGETLGVNYVAMDITDQVKIREKQMDIRVREAVQKAKEAELSRCLHITEEKMRAKQALATMSNEIRSPLSGVLSMAQILATTNLDKQQYQLLQVILSCGDFVLQSLNNSLDISKVESGAMKLKSTMFRPRDVVKHILQTAAASVKKELTLEDTIDDDVPLEVTGDVLRMLEVLTNLISNAVKFTQEGKVGINLSVVDNLRPGCEIEKGQLQMRSHSASPIATTSTECSAVSPGNCDKDSWPCCNHEYACRSGIPSNENFRERQGGEVIWLRCDVYDTGIGIPEKSLPFLFWGYMQTSGDYARKFGGTGLGLPICKQLVELMGGTLTFVSKVNEGSTFTVLLPCKIPVERNVKLAE